MSERDELARLIMEGANFWDDDEGTAPELILAAGYRKPRTITDHYAEGGTEFLRVGSVIVSHGEALVAQSDGTFCDPTGSTWDFWELELPITVLYEPTE